MFKIGDGVIYRTKENGLYFSGLIVDTDVFEPKLKILITHHSSLFADEHPYRFRGTVYWFDSKGAETVTVANHEMMIKRYYELLNDNKIDEAYQFEPGVLHIKGEKPEAFVKVPKVEKDPITYPLRYKDFTVGCTAEYIGDFYSFKCELTEIKITESGAIGSFKVIKPYRDTTQKGHYHNIGLDADRLVVVKDMEAVQFTDKWKEAARANMFEIYYLTGDESVLKGDIWE